MNGERPQRAGWAEAHRPHNDNGAQARHGHAAPGETAAFHHVSAGASGPAGGGGGAGGVPGLDVRSLLGALRRRKVMIAALVALATLGALFHVSRLVPLYRAEAQLIIEPDRRNVTNAPEVVRGLTNDWMTTRTEAQVIASRELAKTTVRRLDLERSPVFNPQLRPPKPGLMESASRAVATLLAAVGLSEPPAPLAVPEPVEPGDPESDPALLDWLAGVYLDGLDVQASENSRVVTVGYVSTDPETAARAANTAAEVYIDSLESERSRGTIEAARFLQEQVARAQQEVVAAQRELEVYRREAGVTQIGGELLPARQLAQLEPQLAEARAARSEAQANYNQVRRLINEPSQLEQAGAVVGSSIVQSLRLQEIEQQRKIAELSTQYRDKHPRMINARAELEDLRAQIRSEIAKIASNQRNQLEIARAREASLQEEVDRLRDELERTQTADAELAELRTRVEVARQQYETLLQRLQEVDMQEEAPARADARIINRASVPGGPFYPNKPMIVATAAIAAMVFGIGLALVLELLDSGFRSLAQIEAQTGVPVLGIVPLLRLRRGEHAYRSAIDDKGSHFAESVRSLRTGVMLCDPKRPPRSLLVTSSLPSEGKSSTVLSIATQAAVSGRRVIVIDCDMRHPSVGPALGVGTCLGLADYLAGQARIDEVIGQDGATGLHFITAGSGRVRPVELLASPRMNRLLQALEKEFHLVVLDTPPLLPVSDALPLMREADATLFLVRWEKTKREVVKAGLRQALEAGARLAGVAMTYVDTRKLAQYDYADSRYRYDASYRKYYSA
jgi:capsular exopolysaccharide synthesis family protein